MFALGAFRIGSNPVIVKIFLFGEMAEWLKALILNINILVNIKGSNPFFP